MEWISVEDQTPSGKCLVKLESDLCGNVIHSANISKEYQIIATVFAWDAPRITHWMPLPEPPKN